MLRSLNGVRSVTNRKFKDYRKNKIAYNVVVDNYKMLCIILLTLHDLYPKTFYAKKMQEWLEDFADSCKMMNDYENDGAYDFKMKQFVEECGIDEDVCIKIVRKHLKNHNWQNAAVLAENVKLAFVQLSCDYGFGKQRLGCLIKTLITTSRTNALEEIKAFGIENEWDIGQMDYTKLKPKKEKKISIAESREAKAGLEAFRRWTNENIPQKEEG